VKGRPPLDHPRDVIRRVRLASDEDDTISAAAERANQPIAVWMRERLLAAAKRQR
jgi:hypothetical protein